MRKVNLSHCIIKTAFITLHGHSGIMPKPTKKGPCGETNSECRTLFERLARLTIISRLVGQLEHFPSSAQSVNPTKLYELSIGRVISKRNYKIVVDFIRNSWRMQSIKYSKSLSDIRLAQPVIISTHPPSTQSRRSTD